MCPSHADEVSLRFSFRFFFLLVVVVEKKLRRGPSVKTRPAKRSARSFCVVVAVVVVVVVVVGVLPSLASPTYGAAAGFPFSR